MWPLGTLAMAPLALQLSLRLVKTWHIYTLRSVSWMVLIQIYNDLIWFIHRERERYRYAIHKQSCLWTNRYGTVSHLDLSPAWSPKHWPRCSSFETLEHSHRERSSSWVLWQPKKPKPSVDSLFFHPWKRQKKHSNTYRSNFRLLINHNRNSK